MNGVDMKAAIQKVFAKETEAVKNSNQQDLNTNDIAQAGMNSWFRRFIASICCCFSAKLNLQLDAEEAISSSIAFGLIDQLKKGGTGPIKYDHPLKKNDEDIIAVKYKIDLFDQYGGVYLRIDDDSATKICDGSINDLRSQFSNNSQVTIQTPNYTQQYVAGANNQADLDRLKFIQRRQRSAISDIVTLSGNTKHAQEVANRVNNGFDKFLGKAGTH